MSSDTKSNDDHSQGPMITFFSRVMIAPLIVLRETSCMPGFYFSLILISLSVGQYLPRAIEFASFPHELRYGEAVVMDQARRVSEDPGLYPEIGKEPWLFDQYAPGYPIVVNLVKDIFESPYGGGRWVSVISTLLAALCLAGIVYRARDALDPEEAAEALQKESVAKEENHVVGRQSRIAPILAVGVFFSLLEIMQFGMMARVDAFALMFTLAGAYLTLRQESKFRLVGALCFFCAVYTRQTMLAIMLLTYVELLMRAGKTTLRWPLGLLATGLIFAGLLNYGTDGRFLTHAVTSNLFPMNWDYGAQKYLGSFTQGKLFLFLAMFITLIAHIRKGAFAKPLGATLIGTMLLTIYRPVQSVIVQGRINIEWDIDSLLIAHGVLLFAALFLLVFSSSRNARLDAIKVIVLLAFTSLIARDGSDLNYLFEPSLLMILVPTCFLVREGRQTWFFSGLIILLLMGQISVCVYQNTGQKEFPADRIQEISERTRVLKNLEAFGDPVLSEEPWVLVESGRPLVIEPYTARQMYEKDLWQAEELRKAIMEHRFPAVIRSKQRVYAGIDPTTKLPYFGPWTFNNVRSFPPKIQSLLDKHYKMVKGSEFIEKVTDYYLVGRQVWIPRKL